jgi:hypothetical protein
VRPAIAGCTAFSKTERLNADAAEANRPTAIGIVPNLHTRPIPPSARRSRRCVAPGARRRSRPWLYADGRGGDAPWGQQMVRGEPLVGAAHGYLYSARMLPHGQLGTPRPACGPTPPAAAVPLEAAQILWQR